MDGRNLKIPSILDELLRTHWLFFCRDFPSKKLMQTDFQRIELNIISDYCDRYKAGIPSANISDFPIYGSRLRLIHQRLTEWHPQNILNLIHRPYGNTIAYYGFCFAFLFSVLNLVQLGLNIYSVVETRSSN